MDKMAIRVYRDNVSCDLVLVLVTDKGGKHPLELSSTILSQKCALRFDEFSQLRLNLGFLTEILQNGHFK